MGWDAKSLPDWVLSKMDKADRPKGVLTAVEAIQKELNRTEAQEQRQFSSWLLLAEERGELTFDWSATHKKVTRRVGHPDFTIYPDHKETFFIEFKLPSGQVSPEQDRYFKRLIDLGKLVFIVPTCDEAIRIVRKQLETIT
jgi:VRR-NUC domain